MVSSVAQDLERKLWTGFETSADYPPLACERGWKVCMVGEGAQMARATFSGCMVPQEPMGQKRQWGLEETFWSHWNGKLGMLCASGLQMKGCRPGSYN